MLVNIKEEPTDFIVWKDFAYKKQGYIFMLCVCGAVRLASGWKFFFFQLPAGISNIFVTYSSKTPSITIAGPSNLQHCVFVKQFLRILNSQKCLSKTKYHKFEGPAIAMVGNWVLKIVVKKIEPWIKKQKKSVWFFWPRFSLSNHPQRPPPQRNHHRTLEFMILCPQTFLRIYTSQS